MRIIILMVVCLLFSMHPVQAQSEITDYPMLAKVETFLMDACRVIIIDDAEYPTKDIEGLQQELTDYLRLKIRQNFPVLVNSEAPASTSDGTGYIDVPIRLLLIPETDVAFYSVTSRFRYTSPCLEYFHLQAIGYDHKENITVTLKDDIRELVEQNAIAFYKLKGAIR